jgi:G6PDH family F420-dependent oxidoreductase
MSFGTVCAPVQRYHPAVIAQAAATLAEMSAGRFWLAIGTGEALNESITGAAWPAKPARRMRVTEAAALMRRLWTGETVTTETVTPTGSGGGGSMRLYSLPAQPPLLLGAALTPDTARWVASWADGLITASGAVERMREVVDAFRDVAGDTKPIFLQSVVSYAPSDAEAEDAAFDQWRHSALSPADLSELRSPPEFDRASAQISRSNVLGIVRASADIARHEAWVREDAELGFDRIYLHNVARAHQVAFIDACGTRLLAHAGLLAGSHPAVNR